MEVSSLLLSAAHCGVWEEAEVRDLALQVFSWPQLLSHRCDIHLCHRDALSTNPGKGQVRCKCSRLKYATEAHYSVVARLLESEWGDPGSNPSQPWKLPG